MRDGVSALPKPLRLRELLDAAGLLLTWSRASAGAPRRRGSRRWTRSPPTCWCPDAVASMELPPISQLPWAVGHDRFLAAAGAVTGEGACCLFVIDEAIPASARSGYAALVIAYARANEPVTILEGGAAALLIRDGGVASGQVAARACSGR